MTASLQDDLAALTGEEIYHLLNELGQATARCLEVAVTPGQRDRVSGDFTGLWTDCLDAELTARAQIARITIPIREAAAIVYRTRYARGRPVRVPGT